MYRFHHSLLVVFVLGTGAGPAIAAEPDLSPPPVKEYVVDAAVFARREPSNDAAVVNKLTAGQTVEALGRTADGWFHIRTADGGEGYVFNRFLRPKVEGALDNTLAGTATGASGQRCDYVIVFAGKSPSADGVITTADYEIDLTCKLGAQRIDVPVFMFIVEQPQPGTGAFQITVDLRDVEGGFEDPLSIAFAYDPAAGTIRLESLTPKRYQGSAIRPRKVPNTVQALRAAVEMAVGGWGPNAWREIAALKP